MRKKQICFFCKKKNEVFSILFIFCFFLIFFVLFIYDSYAFMNVFSTQRLVNYSIIFDIYNEESAAGKLNIVSNKIPQTNEFQYVFNPLESKYNISISREDTRIVRSYSTLINLTAKMFDVPVLDYNDLKAGTEESDEYVCYNDLCGEKYDVLNYIASNLSSYDAFEFACKVNHFVHEYITYDKALVDDQNPTITRILSVKRGVCMHYATLFNEMMKSIGLKSRIVYGMAKSSENDTQWDAHAWNEVYLGKWIPFDPTYDYCGLIDSMHIQLSNESLRTTITFINTGNVKFDDSIEVKEIQNSNETFKFNISYKIRFEYEKVNFDSEQVAYVVVKNNEDTYAFANLKIISTNRVKVQEDMKFIVLKPKETKVVEFLLKPEYYDQNYIYTIPVSIYDSWENSAMNSFVISREGVHFTFDKTKKAKTIDFALNCNNLNLFISKEFSVSQDFDCEIVNMGQSFVSPLEVYLNASNEYYLIENRSLLLGIDDSEAIISNSTKLIDAIRYLYFVEHKKNFSLIVKFKGRLYKYNISVNVLNYSVVQKDDCFYLNATEIDSVNSISLEWFANGIHQEANVICISDVKERLMPMNDFNLTIRFKVVDSEFVAEKDIIIEVKVNTLERIFNALKAFFTWLFDFSEFEE